MQPQEAVEAVSEYLPQTNAVSPLALIIEPVDSVHRGTFMVPPKKEEVLRIFDLVSE